MANKIKIGIFGARRGRSFAAAAVQTDAEVVALCDRITEKAAELKEAYAPNATLYANFDEFLNQDMDAVILCNYFHEHASYAIKALKAGKHVMSECLSNFTIAQGVELCRTVEETGKIYKLAENYPYCASNMEMRNIYKGGTLGKVLYAEGEYVHPMSKKERNRLNPGDSHWRNWIPTTYYITHSMAPLMYITDGMPKEINARAVSAPELMKGTAVRAADGVGIILCTMDNGAVYRVTGCASFAGHGNWYRIAGTRGAVESIRGNQSDILLRYNHWDIPVDGEESRTYTAQWPFNAELAKKAGHGGGDFWVMYNFVESIKNGKQPYFDVYRGVTVSSVGILAWKSVLQGGAPVKMPNFRHEAERKLYENDHTNPNPFADIPDGYRIQCSQDKDFCPSAEDLAEAYKDWAEFSYTII